jgi:uncharacterized OB-fold protein
MGDRDLNSTSFLEFLGEHKLMGSQCRSCGALHLPPRALCPTCYGEEMEWVEMPQVGKLVAFTTVHIGLAAMIDAGYDRKNPYCVGIVELGGGSRISAQILGVDATKPEDISIGMEVRVAFVERGDGEDQRTFLAFQP